VKALAARRRLAEIEVANPAPGSRQSTCRASSTASTAVQLARESSAGSGLGLAIVKSIAELHGGKVA